MQLSRSRPRRLLGLLAGLSLIAAACGAADDPEPEPAAAEAATEPDDAADVADEPEDEPEPAVEEPTTELDIVVTTSILGDVVATLLGDQGSVTVLMPPGADPHAYQASAADAAAMRDADLVVANGLMLEENLVSVLAAAAEEGVVVLELAEQLDPIEFDWDGPGHSHGGDDHGHSHDDDHGHSHDDDHGHSHDDDHGHSHDDDHGHSHDDDNGHSHDDDNGHSHDDDHGHSHDDDHGDSHDDHNHGPEDPHFWFDPLRMADAVQLIAAQIIALDPTTADWLEPRADELAASYRDLDLEVAEILSVIPDDRRLLVTNHDALGYLADRYGFTVLGTVIPGDTTQAETDPAQFARLIDIVEENGVTVVFAENTDSTRLAEQLASEVIGRSDLEVEVVRIYTDALGEPGSGADTYPGMLRTTAQLMADALG